LLDAKIQVLKLMKKKEEDSPGDPTAPPRQASASAGRSGGDRPMGDA